MRAGCRPFVEDDKQRIERPADSNDNGDLSSGGSEHHGGFLSGNTSRPDSPSAQIDGVFGPRKTTRLCGVALSTRLLDLLGWIGDRSSLSPSVYVRIYNAFGSLCTAQRKLPSFNKALRRGLQTTISCTWGLSTSYSQAAHVPSSKVTCSSPRRPCRNCRRVAALVSMMDSITSFPAPFSTAIEIVSL